MKTHKYSIFSCITKPERSHHLVTIENQILMTLASAQSIPLSIYLYIHRSNCVFSTVFAF